MKVVIEGVLDSSLPWELVAIGIGLALIVELLGIPSLPFAVGVYLPVATMVPIYFGGGLRYLAERFAASEKDRDQRRENGILFGSGLVGGEGLLGVLIAGVAWYTGAAPEGVGSEWAGGLGSWFSTAVLALLAGCFWWVVRSRAGSADTR